MQLSLFYTSIAAFCWENKYSKVIYGDSTAHLQDPAAGRPRDQMMGRSGDVRRTSVKPVSLNSTQKVTKLTLTGYARRYSEL